MSRRWRATPTRSTPGWWLSCAAANLVPELWVAPLEDRELRERLRRRTHLVRMRASAMNRIFGLLTQWGCGSH